MINYNFLGEKFNNKYPYQYRIDLFDFDLRKLEEIKDWINDIELPCSICFSGLYVHSFDEVNLFIMKWQGNV